MARRIAQLLGAAVPMLLVAACATEAPSSLEEQAQSIDKSLICPVCPSETIDQAQVPLARDMQAIVREKLAEGWTRPQILDFFSERYGPSVLASPPKSGVSLTVWILPPIGLLGGATLLYFIFRAMLRKRDDLEEKLPSDEELEPYLALVDQQLEARSKQQTYNRLDSQPQEDAESPASSEDGIIYNG